jgi:hypothetical protein
MSDQQCKEVLDELENMYVIMEEVNHSKSHLSLWSICRIVSPYRPDIAAKRLVEYLDQELSNYDEVLYDFLVRHYDLDVRKTQCLATLI